MNQQSPVEWIRSGNRNRFYKSQIRAIALRASLHTDLEENKVNIIRVLGKNGDSEISWNPHTGEGVRLAQRIFLEKTRCFGYLAFVEAPNGEGSELIREFDPQAQSIILAPRLVGG